MRSFLAIRERFPAASTQLSLLPAPPREASARALLLRAIVARNHGCGLLIAGGEHQPDGNCRRGEDLGQPHADLPVSELADKIGVRLIAYPRMVYVEDRAEYLPESEAPAGVAPADPERRGIPAPHAGRPENPRLVQLSRSDR